MLLAALLVVIVANVVSCVLAIRELKKRTTSRDKKSIDSPGLWS